jgi:hypothetical protein
VSWAFPGADMSVVWLWFSISEHANSLNKWVGMCTGQDGLGLLRNQHFFLLCYKISELFS